MEFKHRRNPVHIIDGREVWESRSVAVVGVIILYKNSLPYVLVSRRGPKAADFQGKMNLVAGYLDWDESGYEALARETWEETGFNLFKYLDILQILRLDIEQPWSVNTKIGENNQNVSLRYGICFQIKPEEDFPELTVEHNEVIGECEEPMWLSLYEIDDYEWAFNHDKVIEDYYNFIHKE